MNRVSKVVATKTFEKAIDKIKHKHQNKLLEEIKDTIIKLQNFEITSQKDNHPLHNVNGFNDIHLQGGKYILIYRYDEDDKVLYVSLRLQDIANHDNLDRANYKETEVNEFDVDSIDESVELNEMALSKADAIDKCASLGDKFVEHFDKIFKNSNAQEVNHWAKEMQIWFDTISNITLKHNHKPISFINKIDWFFTKGSDLESIFGDTEEADVYDKFIKDVNTTNDVKESLKNVLNIDIINEDLNNDKDEELEDIYSFTDNQGQKMYTTRYELENLFQDDESYFWATNSIDEIDLNTNQLNRGWTFRYYNIHNLKALGEDEEGVVDYINSIIKKKEIDEDLASDRKYSINGKEVDRNEFYDSVVNNKATDDNMIDLENDKEVNIAGKSYKIDKKGNK